MTGLLHQNSTSLVQTTSLVHLYKVFFILIVMIKKQGRMVKNVSFYFLLASYLPVT